MKLRAIHAAMAIPTFGSYRDEWINVEEQKYKGMRLDMVQIEGKTVVMMSHPKMPEPKGIFPDNIRYFIPYPPEVKSEPLLKNGTIESENVTNSPAKRGRKPKQPTDQGEVNV